MATLGTRAIAGALGGMSAAGCMTLLRMAARRAGVIDKAVPQVIEDWVAKKAQSKRSIPSRFTSLGSPSLHHIGDHAIHFGYSAAVGSLYGALVRPRLTKGNRSSVAAGAAYGVATWFFGFALVMPLLRATRPPWRATVAENGVNLAAHALYGVALSLVANEILAQRTRGPLPDALRFRQRVG